MDIRDRWTDRTVNKQTNVQNDGKTRQWDKQTTEKIRWMDRPGKWTDEHTNRQKDRQTRQLDKQTKGQIKLMDRPDSWTNRLTDRSNGWTEE